LNKIANPDLILVEGRKMEEIPKMAVGDIKVIDAVKYEDNLEVILSWIKDFIRKEGRE
jgi:molybdopterin-guanine dinucleotide biosynthesis protein